MNSGNLMRLRPIKDYLKSKFITVSDQWITNQLNTNSNISNETVYQNWLNSDLKKISSTNDWATLPTDCNQIKIDEQNERAIKSTLVAKYAVQINSIEDISRPKVLSAADALEYEQNSNSDDSSGNESENQTKLFKKKKTAPKKKEVIRRGPRMLSMVLTDGVTECKAIEYQSIPFLTVNTPIGSKILLSGPFDVYTAVMFLTASNVKLLGGSIPLDTEAPNSGDNRTVPLRTLFPQEIQN